VYKKKEAAFLPIFEATGPALTFFTRAAATARSNNREAAALPNIQSSFLRSQANDTCPSDPSYIYVDHWHLYPT